MALPEYLKKYRKLDSRLLNAARSLITEKKQRKDVLIRILDSIEKSDLGFPVPHSLDYEAWDHNSIFFTDGMILVSVKKRKGKYVSEIQGCWYGNPESEQIPFPKKREVHDSPFDAIAFALADKEDYVNKYYSDYSLLTIQNYEEAARDPLFKEWKNAMFSIGLRCLEFEDLFRAIDSRKCSFRKYCFKKPENLDLSDLPKNISNCIIAVKLPVRYGVGRAGKIIKAFSEKLPESCRIIWQAVHHSKDSYEAVVLVN